MRHNELDLSIVYFKDDFRLMRQGIDLDDVQASNVILTGPCSLHAYYILSEEVNDTPIVCLYFKIPIMLLRRDEL